MPMKKRFRIIRRGERKQFYCVDSETGQRHSLQTSDRDAAEQIVLAKNQALRQPALNLQIAKAYLAGTDNGVNTRTWLNAIESLTSTKHDANKARWQNVIKDPAFPKQRIPVRFRMRAPIIQSPTTTPNPVQNPSPHPTSDPLQLQRQHLPAKAIEETAN